MTPDDVLKLLYGAPPLVASAWGVVKVVQAVRTPHGNGNGHKDTLAGIQRIENRWIASEPMFRQMTAALEATAHTLEMRTPVLENLVKITEGLAAQFTAHDVTEKVAFADMGGRLDAVQKSVDAIPARASARRR